MRTPNQDFEISRTTFDIYRKNVADNKKGVPQSYSYFEQQFSLQSLMFITCQFWSIDTVNKLEVCREMRASFEIS